jgi:hypothetical protein
MLLLCAVQGVLAQLNEHCTVSVLNRNVRVNPDGSWVLPNVPANFGQVRARATCVQNGVTTSGESALFTLPANGVVNLPEIVLGATTQIPVSLSITPERMSFTAIGQTSQLVVTATYPDGSVTDVTTANVGTSYTTSNPAIVTIGADGFVTAVASGTVVIQATNEGAAGIVTATVALSSIDTDGDGIPDDVELALGLNPNNPVDAQEDFDRDGLSNLAESQGGTGLRNPDTDSDGLPDGPEVALGTSPLLTDTDGDGIRDGLEVQTGSNPLDPASVNLTQALASLAVTPATFTLIFNTIIGEASQQLTVIGVLLDGATIDLTAISRGTTYNSSDLTICNFGASDGRVFAGANGACTVTVSNSGFSQTVNVQVQTFTPQPLAFVDIPGLANNVDVSGNFAYVAAGAAGLQVVDVSDRRAPTIVSALDTPGNAQDVKVVGNTAFVADGAAGLQIIDITDPLHPLLIEAVDTPGNAQDVVVRGNLAFVADGSSGLQILNISDLTAPSVLSAIDTPGAAMGVDVNLERQIAVVADGASGLKVIDITNTGQPVLIGSVATGNAQDVALSPDGTFAFVADLSSSLTTVDLSTPRTPIMRATTPRQTGGLLVDVALADRFAFGADIFFVNGVPIVDVSAPVSPLPRAILDFRNFRDDDGTGIAVDGNFVYLTAAKGSSARLYIGQYLDLEDRAGIPPTVAITSPVSGETVIEGARLPITVNATDDITVSAVNLLIDGTLAFTDTAVPYQSTFTVPTGMNRLTLSATAVDHGGNVGVSQEVELGVTPDPLTTVVGVVLGVDGLPVAGASVRTGGLTTGTGPNGTFAFPNAPTIFGDIVVQAIFTPEGGQPLFGRSRPMSPVRGGITDVGQIHLNAGLVAFWPFDDGIDPTADRARGHDGDIVEATFTSTSTAPVMHNVSALVFNGAGDHMFVADTDDLDFGPTSPMSIAVWFQATALRSTIHILGKRVGCSAMNYQLSRDGGLLHFNSDGGRVNTGVDIRVNTFMHMAVTYDGSSTLILYIDGVEVARRTSYTLGSPNTAPLKIGASGTCGNDFPGVIDEVRLYNVALAPAEITELASQNDSDSDGLSDREEVLRGTNPSLADTDQDGWLDGAEVVVGTNPLDPVSQPEAVVLVSGSLRSDTLTVTGEVDLYRFTLAAAERVRVHAINSGSLGIQPCLEVFTATGQAVEGGAGCGGASARHDLVLPAGTYLVLVTDDGANQIGDYTLNLQRLQVEEATALVSGVAVAEMLSTRGELHLYTFTLEAVESVRLQVAATSGVLSPCLEVFTATGQSIEGGSRCGGTSARLDLVLAVGTYLVLVADNGLDHTGNYTLSWQLLQ